MKVVIAHDEGRTVGNMVEDGCPSVVDRQTILTHIQTASSDGHSVLYIETRGAQDCEAAAVHNETSIVARALGPEYLNLSVPTNSEEHVIGSGRRHHQEVVLGTTRRA